MFAVGISRSITPRSGWRVRCHPVSYRAFQVFQRDPLQATELDDFISLCTLGMRFIDVGAHHGFYTMAALHYGGSEARAVSIEASPSAALILQQNIALNNSQSRVKNINLVVGDQDGSVPMLSTGPFGSGYMMVPTKPRADATLLEQRSLDTIVDEIKFMPTHIKIDVEGYEPEVLDGAMGTLQRYRPMILFELHNPALNSRGIDPLGVLRRLNSAGYKEFSCGGLVIDQQAIASTEHNCRLVCRPCE
jgi:FkbM family methyltransferase